MLRLDRFGQDGAHHERAQGRREAHRVGDIHQPEAKPDADDEQHLVGQVFPYRPEDRGDEIDAKHEAAHQEKHQSADVHQQLLALERAADGQRGEQHEHEHGEDVLHDQDPEDDARKLSAAQPHLVEGFEDDRRGRHGQHGAEEDAVHPIQPEGRTDHVADEHHADQHRGGAHRGRAADLHQLLDAEVQSEVEEQEDDADLAPCVDARDLAHRRQYLDGRPRQHARQQVAQYERLFEPFEKQGGQARSNENNDQIDNKRR